MIKKLILFSNIFLLVVASGCDMDTKEKDTYFGGKIINPKSNHVVLYSMDKIIDTFYLNENDKFLGKINNVNECLYYFIHGNENQHIYIEPKDSLMLRLNTWDFDESLVFAGKGAERNNILIDCFLEDEKLRKIFYDYNKLEPKKIKYKVDSLVKIKTETFNDYVNNHPKETKGFKEVLKVALTYPMYSRLERYPVIYSRYSKDKNFPKLDSTFYSFRKMINKDIDSLMYYPPYSIYVRNYLYNETYSLGHMPMKGGYISNFTTDLLTVIDKKISSEQTKNAFLRQTIVSHYYNKLITENYSEALAKFFQLSTNKKDKDFVQKLINDRNAITKNQQILDFNLFDYSDAKKSILNVIKNKKSLIFFWNSESLSESYLYSRVNFLSKNYPTINFIQINMDGKNSKRVKKLDIKNQFYIDSESKAHQFLSSKMPRTIIVNKKGIVLNSDISISSSSLNKFLSELNKN